MICDIRECQSEATVLSAYIRVYGRTRGTGDALCAAHDQATSGPDALYVCPECRRLVPGSLNVAIDAIYGAYPRLGGLERHVADLLAADNGQDDRQLAVAALEAWLGFDLGWLTAAVRHQHEDEDLPPETNEVA